MLKTLFIFLLFTLFIALINPICLYALETGQTPAYSVVTASKTMDIGIIVGVAALVISAFVIYLLRRNHRR